MAIADRRRSGAAALIAIAAFGVVARTLFIGRLPGINGDEAWYGVSVQELLSGGAPFLHTGIGNPLNPFHFGPLLALSAIFEPSATVLRAPEVVLGILTVALAYPLLRRPLGERPALITAVLLAVSPTAVAYARLGWDPSGGPLMTLLAIAFALVDRPWPAMMATVAAWFAHPTNIFVVPIVAAAWAPHGIAHWHATTPVVRTRLRWLTLFAILAAIPAGAWLAIHIAANPQTSLPSISMVIDRVTSPALWADRAWGFVNLTSGVSPVLHIAGPLPQAAALAANGVILLVAVGSIVAGWSHLAAHRHARWLLAGIGIAFAGFHVVAMSFALTPTSERYGIFMLVPLLITIALGLDAVSRRHLATGRAATAATAIVMVSMLVGGYFVPLWTRGGDAMTTYRTGTTEPKLAAFAFIDADSRGAASVRVIADGWWLYWTLRYFAGAGGRIFVDVVPGSNMPGGTHPSGAVVPQHPPPQRTYFVAFEGGAVPPGSTGSKARFTAWDPAGRPILHVYDAGTPP